MNTCDGVRASAPHGIRYVIWALGIHLLTVLMTYAVAPAAVMPQYEHLQPVTDLIAGPVAVAFDRDGRLHVAEAGAGRIVILNGSGRFTDALAGLDSPISVAVDDGGRILVGSKRKGSVQVYDADFTPLFKLGSGDGEFSWPSDICMDSGGRIYVADRGRDIVRVYDSSGRFTGMLGSPGNNDGQFYRPVSITIDEAAGEIIVLDRQLVPGTAKQGARIQFFTMTGAYLRGFSRNSTQEGGMVTPQEIVVDTESRIYVTDSYQNAVLVYDRNGTFLGAVYDLENPLRAPLGMAIDGANRLHVASRMADSIEVYGIDRYTGIEVDPIRLDFTAGEKSTDPASRSITVRNSGTAPFSWGAAADADWLVLSGDNGFLEPGRLAAFDIAVAAAGCAPGEYTGSITVSAGPAATEVVQVVLTVAPAAILSVTSAGLAFTAEAGTVPAPGTVTIANSGSASLHWTASTDQPWIKLSNFSGSLADSEAAPATISVTADVVSLAAGTYSGTITVSGDNALAGPTAIDVTLSLTEPASPPGNGDPPPLPPGKTSWEGNLGRKWREMSPLKGISLNGIWGSSGSDIFAVGDGGVILHYDGGSWNPINTGISSNLNGVWGTSAANVYIIGENGMFLHYNGEKLAAASSSFGGTLMDVWCGDEAGGCFAVGEGAGVLNIEGRGSSWNVDCLLEYEGSLNGIWGLSDSDIYAVGDGGTVLHYDGSNLTSISTGLDWNLYAVWGSAADNVFAVGQNGTVLHYNGTGWEQMDSGTGSTLLGIWGNSAGEVYAVGESGTMLLLLDSQWHMLDTGIAEDLNDAWGSGRKEVYAVGSGGSIIYSRTPFPWRLLFPVIMHNGRQ